MSEDDTQKRLRQAEERLDRLTGHLGLQEAGWRRFVSVSGVRDLLYIIGLPVTVMLAYQAFDREFISAQETRALAQKNLALERLDKLQDINAQIYQLQSQGSENVAFAVIEAKRGLMARLTDAVYRAWVEQPDLLGRYDLNALAEALLVQGRTDHALAVARAVDVAPLGPVETMDQHILIARILFAEGPAFDMEAAREALRQAVPVAEKITREGRRLLMLEKLVAVRLSNEYWRNTGCDKLQPLAAGLAELQAENRAAGAYQDNFGVQMTLEAVAAKCD